MGPFYDPFIQLAYPQNDPFNLTDRHVRIVNVPHNSHLLFMRKNIGMSYGCLFRILARRVAFWMLYGAQCAEELNRYIQNAPGA